MIHESSKRNINKIKDLARRQEYTRIKLKTWHDAKSIHESQRIVKCLCISLMVICIGYVKIKY